MTTPFSRKFYVALVAIFLLCGLHMPFAGADIIIDNGDPGTSSTGTWRVSGAPNPFEPADPNATSLWARGNDSYTWRFTADATGTYEVQMWHTYTSTRGANVPVDVRHASGTDRVYVDQRFDAGQWNSLGTYSFNAGTGYSITLYSLPDPYSTCADAVRLVEIGAVNTPPVATIDSITPNPAPLGTDVTFIGHGDDTDGAIAAYRWDSDRDGYLGNTATLTTAVPLSEGVHLVTFTVTDDEGETDTDSRYLSVQAAVAEFIIDNGDPGTSFTGTWSVSGGANPYDPADPGATSLWARSNDSYTWRFTPSSTGTYEVYMWHTYASTRGTNVPVDIRHAGGTSRVTVNQLVNPGQWNRIGTYTFNAGVSYGVTIYSLPDPYSTCADAVRFVLEGAVNSPPVAAIDEITPTAALPGRTIAFTGSGTDSDGSVAAYEWYSDLDGMLSDQPFFSTASLTPGIHTIFFRVRDNEGSWSAQAVRYVVVRDCSNPVAIMLLGDSITKGVGEVALDDLMTGYRSPLFQALKSAGYYVDLVGNRKTGLRSSPSFDIDHQGTGGITDTEVANNVYDWLTENPAEIVLLHIGTNSFSTSPDDVEDILNEIDRFELDSGTNITVVLARIINRQIAHPDTTVFNNNVESMARSRIAAGDKIVIVDQESALVYPTDMFDLLHPKNSGYAKMSAEWLKGVVDLLPVCGNVTPFIYTTPIENTPTGVAYTYQVGALGTPAPTFSLVSFPVGMTIDSSSGLIEWTPGLAQRGGHTVTIQAANSQGTDTQTFVLEVSDAIIIDNGDPETAFTGTWEVSGGINPWDPADPDANSLWSRDGDTYTWRFTPLIDGNYVVSMWHTAYSSRSASVPVRIAHADGTNTVIVNQQINGGMWNALGTYSFNAGGTYSVTITSQPGPSSTCADAVKFELAAPSPPSITTQPISQSVIAGSTATFSVAASGAQPLNYQWQKNGANIPGATGVSYTTPPCSTADNGAQFRCVVSNSAGSATIGAATHCFQYILDAGSGTA
jgi:lysophospholipase L1-like esterase